MDLPVHVRIVGIPGACPTGVNEPWREVAGWAARQLSTRFGDQVVVEYCDLFSKEMDDFPRALELVQRGEAAVPLIFVGESLLSAGRKVSVPRIREALEALGLEPKHSS
jgi:hypothetical protein